MLPFRGATGEPALLAHRERDINYFALIPTLFHGKGRKVRRYAATTSGADRAATAAALTSTLLVNNRGGVRLLRGTN